MDPVAPAPDTAGMDPTDVATWEPQWPPPHRRPDRGRSGLVISVMLTVMAFAAGLLASAFAEVRHITTCDAGADAVYAGARAALRTELLGIWLAVSVVPAGAAAWAHSTGRRVWPWLTVAGAAVVVAGALVMAAQPVYFCF